MLHIDHKYTLLLAPQLRNFTRKTQELYNFSCPICGDSEKNAHKARGYIFRHKNGLVFKCHNCGDARGLQALLRHVDASLHSQYVVERFKDLRGERAAKPKLSEAFKFEPVKFAKSRPSKMFEGIAVKLTELADDHIARQFVAQREIPFASLRGLYYIDDEEKLESISDKYKDRIIGHSPRLLLPFCDREGNMTGLAGRALDDKGLRYLSLKFNAQDELSVFGMEKWDDRRHTYVVEGPIDSLFLDNALAVGGSGLGALGGILDRAHTTIVFDNEPRNKQICSIMERTINKGWSVVIWPDTLKEKDINDMVLGSPSPAQVQELLNTNTFRGLAATFKLQTWRK